MPSSRRSEAHAAHAFPTTQWTLLQKAAGGLSADQRDALNEVLGQYWPAVRAHLVTRKGVDPDEADDLVQSFVQDRILERGLLAIADRDRGRFRSLLVKSLENFVLNDARRRRAKKRHAGSARSLDVAGPGEPCASTATPPQQAEAAWARETLLDVLARMQAECQNKDRQVLWQLFESRIVQPILEGKEPVDYEQLARRHGFASTAQAQNALVTAKRMFHRTMRAVLAEQGTADAEIDAEIRDIECCLAAY